MDTHAASSPDNSPAGSPAESARSSPELSSLEGCSSDSDADVGPRKRLRAHSPRCDDKAATLALCKIEQHKTSARKLEKTATFLAQVQQQLRTSAATLPDPALGSPLTRLAADIGSYFDEVSAAARNEVDEAARCKQAFLDELQKRRDAIHDFMVQFSLKADAVDLTLDESDEPRREDVLAASPRQSIDTLVTCLKSRERLTGDVINAYLERLVASCGESGQLVALSSYLYPTLVMKPVSKQRPQTRLVDLLAARFVLVPIHLKEEQHWALVVVNVAAKRLLYVDSLLGHRTDVTKLIAGYLNCDAVRKDRPVVDWVDQPCAVPQQTNGVDCGVFLCMAAHAVAMHVQDGERSADAEIAWRGSHSHVARFRAHIRNTLTRVFAWFEF